MNAKLGSFLCGVVLTYTTLTYFYSQYTNSAALADFGAKAFILGCKQKGSKEECEVKGFVYKKNLERQFELIYGK